MKKTVSAQNGHGLKIFWLFCATVFFLIAISLILKGYTVVVKSLFDGSHRFTFAQGTKPLRIYSFAPDTKTISILDITPDSEQSQKSLQNAAKIPIDASIASKQKGSGSEQESSSFPPDQTEAYVKHLFFHYNDIKTDMTALDLFRLWLFARSIDPSEIVYEKITLSKDPAQQSTFDKIALELFIDDAIVAENKSIQVVNATGISGVGNDFSRLLTNMGGNVVSVTTAKKDALRTLVQYYGEPGYTVRKIEKIVKKSAIESKKRTISDIIVILGKDRIEK